jgi:hypothetical protein
MSQLPEDAERRAGSPSARAADAADLMAVALRLGVGLPAGVERQSAESLDAVARTLRDGDGSDSSDAVDAILSIVPAPARGIMRLAAAGGDIRTLLGFLERIVALDRRRRWERVVALGYPIAVVLAAVAGIVVLAFVLDPLINAFAEPMQMALPPPEVTASPVFDAVGVPAWIAAALVVAVVWGSQGQRRVEVSRRWAAVASELEGICDEIDIGPERCEQILEDLWPVTTARGLAKTPPPLMQFLRKQRLAEGPRAFAAVARLYQEMSDAVGERRVRLLPVVGALVAGMAVLLYGIALFVPLTRLFDTVASMPVAPPWSPGS